LRLRGENPHSARPYDVRSIVGALPPGLAKVSEKPAASIASVGSISSPR
jgi:hypothetical protein